MISLILSIIIIIGITSRFYLKFSPMKSFVTFMSTIIGFIVAFSFHETVAGFLISKGFLVNWLGALSFILVFLTVSLALENLSDYIVGANIDFGPSVKVASAVVFGALSGLIIAGAVNIAIALAPMGKTIPYSRFGDTLNVSNATSPLIPGDSFITGFYKLISNGALGKETRFDVVHADYLNQLHLNRYAAKEGVSLVAAKNAVSVNKFGVQKKELPNGKELTVIELKINTRPVKDGGAKAGDKEVSFSLAQVRLLCVPEGKAEITPENMKIRYPEMYLIKGQPIKEDVKLSDVVQIERDMIEKQIATVGLAFDVPENFRPGILQFKANNIINLPKPVTQEEIDEAAKEQQDNSVPPGGTAGGSE